MSRRNRNWVSRATAIFIVACAALLSSSASADIIVFEREVGGGNEELSAYGRIEGLMLNRIVRCGYFAWGCREGRDARVEAAAVGRGSLFTFGGNFGLAELGVQHRDHFGGWATMRAGGYTISSNGWSNPWAEMRHVDQRMSRELVSREKWTTIGGIPVNVRLAAWGNLSATGHIGSSSVWGRKILLIEGDTRADATVTGSATLHVGFASAGVRGSVEIFSVRTPTQVALEQVLGWDSARYSADVSLRTSALAGTLTAFVESLWGGEIGSWEIIRFNGWNRVFNLIDEDGMMLIH